MRSDVHYYPKSAAIALATMPTVTRVCLVLAVAQLSFSGCRHNPPDLTACTKIELHYADGALNYFIPHTAAQNSILSEDERRCVQSYDTWAVTDPQLIRAFAYDVSHGTYSGTLQGRRKSPGVDVLCWRGSERIASFTVYSRSIVTAGKSEFEYSPGMPDLTILEPPAVKPLKARWKCAWNLSKLLFEGLARGRDRLYPDPNRWCDVVVEFLRSQHVTYSYLNDTTEYLRSDASIRRMFACPSVHVSTAANDAHANLANQTVLIWRSDYALTPHCGKDSLGDTVFLFESNPGWNQYAGPESFTFDNHNPRGGSVLLNDGTMKFIRTEEELKQLRWKP
jgi:hypothetical protein